MRHRILSLAALASVALCVTGARQFNGSNQYINSPASPVVGTPLTIAAWAYMDSTNNAVTVGSVTSGALTRAQIGFSAGGLAHAVSVNTGGSSGSAVSTNVVGPNEWHHIAGVFLSGTDRRVWLDGVLQATNNTSATLGVTDRVTIGMRITSSAVGLYFQGRIAEFAVWNITLSDADIAMLAAGAKPYRVRPNALVSYFPLPGEAAPEPNWKGTAGNLTNAPTAGAHPRVY